MRSARLTTASAVSTRFRPFLAAQFCQQQRQLDVLRRGQHRHEIVELEDEADIRGAEARELALRQGVDALPRHMDLPAVGMVDTAEQIEQCGLAGPDGPITATKSPRAMAMSSWSKIEMVSLPLTNFLLRAASRTIVSANVFSCVSCCSIARAQSAAADSFAGSCSRNVTFAAMSGRMRGSLRFTAMRTLTVAFSRFAVGTIAITAAGMVQSG